MDDELIEMSVESVRVHMLSSRHVVILKEQGRERYLPIWIGPWEASAIAMRLQGLTPERPLTHDLFASALEAVEARVSRVIITDLTEETFHARLFVERDGRVGELDARPSDALALAVRVGAPIFAMPSVLDRAALGADSSLADEDDGDPLERSAGGIVDPRLDVFREFINSLDVDPDAEGRTRS